jgi:hypothetical protein
MNLGITTIDTVLTILSNDSGSNKVTILSNDVNALIIKTNIISNDAVDWENNRVSRDAALATLSIGTSDPYAFPTSGSTAGYVLSMDATGTNAQWGIVSATGGTGTPGGANTQIQYNNGGSFGGTTMSWDTTNLLFTCATQPAFDAHVSSNALIIPNTTQKLSADNVSNYGSFNDTGDYAPTHPSWSFTAPTNGRYLFVWNIDVTSIDSAATEYNAGIAAPATSFLSKLDPRQLAGDMSGSYTFAGSKIIKLNSGNTVYCYVYQAGGSTQTAIIAVNSYWGGQLIN